MGAAKEAMGGGEAPPHDPAEAEAAINAEADKAGAAGNSDLMAKLKTAATSISVIPYCEARPSDRADTALRRMAATKAVAWRECCSCGVVVQPCRRLQKTRIYYKLGAEEDSSRTGMRRPAVAASASTRA